MVTDRGSYPSMNFFTDIITYPFRGGGKYILLIGAMLSLGSDLASMAPLVGGIASLLLFGYFCAVYFKIIESSAVGGKEAPEYPELSNLMEDVIWPMLQIVLILLVSFGPLWGYLFAFGEAANGGVVLALTCLGILYAPMALLAVVILGYMGALSPHIVIPAVFRAGWLYLAAILLLGAIYGIEACITHFLAGWFIVKFLILAVTSMYCLMANGRALGLIFRDRREELNWV